MCEQKLTDDRLREIAFKQYMELELCGAQPYQMLVVGVNILGMTVLRVTGRDSDYDSFTEKVRDLLEEYILCEEEEGKQMAKIEKVYKCARCGSIIEYGDDEAVEYGNYLYCDEDCLFKDLGVDCVDWSCREEFEDDGLTRENFYGAFLAKDRIITNGRYTIVGADTSELNIDDGYYPNPNRIYAQLFDMRVAIKHTKTKVVKLSESKIFDNTDGHIKGQQRIIFVEILGCKLDKRYVDLCVELLGLSDELRVCNDDPESPLLIEADDERFAVIMPVVWDN